MGDTIVSLDCKPSRVPLRRSYFHTVSEVPLVSETLGDILEDAANENPDHVVFRVPEFQEQITLRDLKTRADELSKSLLTSGLEPGGVVWLIGVTDIEFFVIFYAVTQIGLTFLFPEIDSPPEKDTMKYLKTKPCAIFIGRYHESESLPIIHRYANSSKKQNAPSQQVPVVMVNSSSTFEDFIPYQEFLKQGHKLQNKDLWTARQRVSIDTVAVLFESSEVLGFLSPVEDDASSAIQVVVAVCNRIVAVMAPPELTSAPESVDVFLNFIDNERITWYSGLPFELVHAINYQDKSKYNISSLRGGNLLGQATSLSLKKKILEVFPDSLTIFGATEAFAGISTSTVWSTKEQRFHTSGYPYPHLEVKLVNNQNEIVPIGEQGEICIRGWTVMKEYFDDEELTAQVKDPRLNGWYHFGDIGTMDETGHVTFIGRKAECVRFKHYSDTIYPVRILEVLENEANINVAKVVGIPSDEKGDDICVCIEPKPNCEISIERLETLMKNKFPRTGSRKKGPDDSQGQHTKPTRSEAPGLSFMGGGDSQSRLSEDSNSSLEDSSQSRPLPALAKTEGPTSFQGIFSSSVSSGLTLSGTPSPVPTSSSSTNVDPSKSHKAKKKKKKNKHKHKHKHKHDRQERERGRDSKERYSSTGVSSPMVPSVQSMTSVTSMSSVDNTRDSGPDSPEFEVI